MSKAIQSLIETNPRKYSICMAGYQHFVEASQSKAVELPFGTGVKYSNLANRKTKTSSREIIK